MNIAAILAWIEIVANIAALFERAMAVGNRLKAGEEITAEELAALKIETDAAVARWNAAAADADADTPET